ncbi:hypothetical protein ACTFIU_007803 [Dictyostelium citrinum]
MDNNKIIEYLNQNNISFDLLKQIVKNNKDIEKEEINFVKYKTTTNNKQYTLNVIAYFSNGNDIIKITTFHDIKHMIYNKNENDENDLTTSIIIPGLKKCEKKQIYLDESNTEVIKKGEINSKLTFKNKPIQYSIIFELENNSNAIYSDNNNNNNIYNTNIPFNRDSFIDLNPIKGIPIDYNCSIGNIYENNSNNLLIRLSNNNNNNDNDNNVYNTPGLFQISYPISQNLQQHLINQKPTKQQPPHQQQKQQSQKQHQHQQSHNTKGKKQNSNQNKQQQQQQQHQKDQKDQKENTAENENEKESEFDKFNNLYRIDNTYKQQLKELNQKVQDLQYKLKTTQIQMSIMESNSISNKNIIDQEVLNKIKLNLFSQEHSLKFEINSFIDDIKLLEQQIKLINHNIIKSNENSNNNGNGDNNNNNNNNKQPQQQILVTETKSKDDIIKFWNDYGEIYLTIKNEISEITLCQYGNFILKIKEIFSKNMKNSNLIKFNAFCN